MEIYDCFGFSTFLKKRIFPFLFETEENARSPSPVEIMHPPSLPFAVDIEENVDDDTNSLPGSINIPEMVSNLEESPV